MDYTLYINIENNPFIHIVKNYQKYFKNFAVFNAARFLENIWPFFNIMNKGLNTDKELEVWKD